MSRILYMNICCTSSTETLTAPKVFRPHEEKGGNEHRSLFGLLIGNCQYQLKVIGLWVPNTNAILHVSAASLRCSAYILELT